MAILLLSSAILLNPSYGFASSTEQSSDAFVKPDQIIFDFSPPEKVNGPSTSNAFSSPMLNSLFQGVDNREVCGDHKDNNKNGLVDENCSALPSDEQNSIIEHTQPDNLIQSPPSSSPPLQDDNELNPEQEICGDGQDNDGNGSIDENCGGPSPEQEICGDGQDNDGNGSIDENCGDQQQEPLASNPPQDDNTDDGSSPEQEICGDGQDNDGNGIIDENCGDQQQEPLASNPPPQDGSDD